MHIVAARFDTIKNMPHPRIDLKSAALPARAGIKKQLKPRRKRVGATREKMVACQVAWPSG